MRNTLYEAPDDAGNVVRLQPRIKETREIESPLDVPDYRSVDEALEDFAIRVGVYYLGEEDREAFKADFLKNGLSRSHVAERARAAMAQQEGRNSG